MQKAETFSLTPAAARVFIPPISEGALTDAGLSASVYGIDVSRDAILACAARDRAIVLAVASISAIPMAKESVDILINLFAPFDAREFSRVMKPGGILIRAFPVKGIYSSSKRRLQGAV